jgi:4'-phosphopantetheinyl transferase
MPSVAQVQLWPIELDTTLGPFLDLLSGEESDRARRFHFPVHRRRFVVARGMLRTILGGWLGVAPAEVRFEYGANGKPALEGAAGPHFSVSHSEDWAVIALCDDRPLGIDLEKVRQLDDLAELAAMVFNDRERRQLQALTGDARTLAFFRGWSRKEAYFKATGAGLSAPLHSVTVDLAEQRPCILEIDDDDPARWSMQDITAPPGFVAALAVPAARTQVTVHPAGRPAGTGSPFGPAV